MLDARMMCTQRGSDAVTSASAFKWMSAEW